MSRIKTARDLHFSPDDVRHAIRHAIFVRGHGGDIEQRLETVVARVNHGRWIADCPNCNAGIALHPEWDRARCFGCGAIYRNLTWPAHPRLIARVLRARVIRHQNWEPGETVADLIAENVAHAVVDLTVDETFEDGPTGDLVAEGG